MMMIRSLTSISSWCFQCYGRYTSNNKWYL